MNQERFRIIKQDKILFVYCNIYGKIDPSDLFNEIISLFYSIEVLALSGTSIIKILFFDYSLFYIFAEPKNFISSDDWFNKFHKWNSDLQFWILRFKAEFFSKIMEIAAKEPNKIEINLWGEVGIDFDIIKLIDYKNHVFKAK